MTAAPRRACLAVALALLAALPSPAVRAHDGVRVEWLPARPRAGGVAILRVLGAPAAAEIEALVDGHPAAFFPVPGGHAALVGIDMDAAPGIRAWRVTVRDTYGRAEHVAGTLQVRARAYEVEHLTVAPGMAVLDPEAERRADAEAERMRETYRTISGERLWNGAFVRPVAGTRPATGFGARRVINGHPRAPHGGIDFPAPEGAPVVAANRGRVALVGEFYFPGRLVILDHGLGLHTAYFHLDTIAVEPSQMVERGAVLGTVGMTGRVTGPHLHFAAQVGSARIDPAVLLALALAD